MVYEAHRYKLSPPPPLDVAVLLAVQEEIWESLLRREWKQKGRKRVEFFKKKIGGLTPTLGLTYSIESNAWALEYEESTDNGLSASSSVSDSQESRLVENEGLVWEEEDTDEDAEPSELLFYLYYNVYYPTVQRYRRSVQTLRACLSGCSGAPISLNQLKPVFCCIGAVNFFFLIILFFCCF